MKHYQHLGNEERFYIWQARREGNTQTLNSRPKPKLFGTLALLVDQGTCNLKRFLHIGHVT